MDTYNILNQMAPKIIKQKDNVKVIEKEVEKEVVKENVSLKLDGGIKAKRGRKSKKELMASLNMGVIIKDTEIPKLHDLPINKITNNNIISLNVNEIHNNLVDLNSENIVLDSENIILDSENIVLDSENIVLDSETNIVIISKPASKKRGRKPKGGKIIQQILNDTPQKEDKPNVILHLKCSMKDLKNNTQQNTQHDGFVDSYNVLNGKNDSNYEIICTENLNKLNENTNYNNSNFESDNDAEVNDNIICKDTNKEIWKKLKQLEHNLHINNVNNKRSACLWDSCEFDNPPVYIPKYIINGIYHVYGCFCSPECGVAYLMKQHIDTSAKYERYHLFNNIYAKIYDYKKNIKEAPDPHYMLEKYLGNLTIQEYRSLLRNERLYLIVDKPLTRILPELHEDNDDFILNNKIIPSNTYQIKTRLQKKKQNKTSILNEKFGVSNQLLLE